MITIFHARAGYKFRFVTVAIAGTLIKLPVEGGTEKGSASESFRLLEPRKAGEGRGRGSGVIASSASALRHICYAIKKSTTS